MDKTAKLVDINSLEVLKTYKTGRFVQSAAVSPLFDHVLLGGGQDASQVRIVTCFVGYSLLLPFECWLVAPVKQWLAFLVEGLLLVYSNSRGAEDAQDRMLSAPSSRQPVIFLGCWAEVNILLGNVDELVPNTL